MIDSPRLGARENMHIDREMLSGFAEDAQPLFRLYGWESSVSIGISQDFETLVQQDKSLTPYRETYAKRMTGGGILYHGHDLSYSLVIPSVWMRGLSVKESYEKITAFVLDFYQELGLDAHWAKDDAQITLQQSSYCQKGYEPYDVIVHGHKMGGNAQKRTKKAIFQHGSIPLYRHAQGLSLEALGMELEEREYRKIVREAFAKQLKEWYYGQ